ncbi:MAG: benzoate-CoA ligase family protein [Bacillota bacterium]|nr:benzoate-CoA ligase family protein [Bacillota bacterium]
MINIPAMTDEFNLGDFLLDRHIREGRGDKAAIYYKDKVITYRELLDAANRTGNALLELGVEEENRVMICLPDCPEFLYSYFGAMRIGAVPVPVSTMALPQDYKYYLNDSRAKVLITDEDLAPKFVEVSQELRYLRHFIVSGKSGSGQLSFEDLLEQASSSLEPALTSKDDMVFWLYSSGTTGTPKGVVHLHHDMMFFMPPYCEKVLSMTEDDIVYSASKMYFSYGRNASIETVFLCGAAVILVPELPKPEVVAEVITRYKPTLYFSIPTSYMGVLDLLEKEEGKYDFSSLRVCISAGEAMPKVIFDRWEKKFGIEIFDGIGSTDVGGIYISNLPGKVKPGSCGVLLPGFEAKLADDDVKEVPDGEVGSLWIKNDGTTPFYWKKHQKSKEAILGEWFNTGDQFYKDSDDFYWFSGRGDDMLKAGGIWVSPVEVEGILLEHPAVLECGVVGNVDAANLEKPLAFVVLREGYEASSQLERELQDFVRSKTASYKYPRWVKFVEELPRTASGKVQRFKLRALLKDNKVS